MAPGLGTKEVASEKAGEGKVDKPASKFAGIDELRVALSAMVVAHHAGIPYGPSGTLRCVESYPTA